ncbi:hypothetical protein K402DRAFT_25684 [Aulographum hederae CBS 113979]|uniref:Uncharacterized protein n=1 Tax=Aulographum hederae CBS 113979 TaxID=1176131 RepID=A0A6G1H5N7_9PEZI|nr:hypothetical protein K402DRAFT_25684 [Aulographum hederae CBS 113979]
MPIGTSLKDCVSCLRFLFWCLEIRVLLSKHFRLLKLTCQFASNDYFAGTSDEAYLYSHHTAFILFPFCPHATTISWISEISNKYHDGDQAEEARASFISFIPKQLISRLPTATTRASERLNLRTACLAGMMVKAIGNQSMAGENGKRARPSPQDNFPQPNSAGSMDGHVRVARCQMDIERKTHYLVEEEDMLKSQRHRCPQQHR